MPLHRPHPIPSHPIPSHPIPSHLTCARRRTPAEERAATAKPTRKRGTGSAPPCGPWPERGEEGGEEGAGKGGGGGGNSDRHDRLGWACGHSQICDARSRELRLPDTRSQQRSTIHPRCITGSKTVGGLQVGAQHRTIHNALLKKLASHLPPSAHHTCERKDRHARLQYPQAARSLALSPDPPTQSTPQTSSHAAAGRL